MKRKVSITNKKPSLAPFTRYIKTLDEFKQLILPDWEESIQNTKEYYQDIVEKVSLFAPGKYMWYVVERLTIFQMGGMVEYFMGKGKEASSWIGKNPEEYFAYLYPEDAPFVMTYAQILYNFLTQIKENERSLYHPNLYFRLYNPEKNGFKIVLFQYIYWKYDIDHGIESILHLISDISHIEQPSFKPMLTILDEKSGILHFTKSISSEIDETLNSVEIQHITNREKEIIKLMAKGLYSKQISELLQISKNTVENHRQNILKKTNCSSSAEVVAYALKFGLL